MLFIILSWFSTDAACRQSVALPFHYTTKWRVDVEGFVEPLTEVMHRL